MSFDESRHPRGGDPANTGRFSEAAQSAPELTLGAEWPAHGAETRPWQPTGRPSRREDRLVTSVEVSLPPMIGELDYRPPRDLLPELDAAEIAIVDLDRAHGVSLASLGQLLIRTESVASSRIEEVEASSDDFARATAGISTHPGAVSMVAASDALVGMTDAAGESGTLTVEMILTAHETLMRDDRFDGRYAGRFRSMQNWIGGNDGSPLNAVHVPPPPETVAAYMDDLLVFANRDDVDALAQAAIVHAQFESIHPFTDGNGRVGRALIGAVLRRRQLTTVTVVPLASALLAERQRYFDQVNGYRTGAVTPFVRDVARAARLASGEAIRSAEALRRIPGSWAEISTPRAGSAAASILGALLDHPVLSVADAQKLSAGSSSSAFEAMTRLEADGVVREVTGRKRDRVWVATEVLAELDHLNARIGDAVRRVRSDPRP